MNRRVQGIVDSGTPGFYSSRMIPPFISSQVIPRRELRQRLRLFRQNLSSSQQRQSAAQLCLRLTRNRGFAQAKHIAFYLANDGELSVLPLLHIALRRHKFCYLPRLEGGTLEFVRYQRGDPLQINRFGIAEPLAHLPAVALATLNLILLPLVGFDRRGNRLGMGGGFYDKTLAKWRRPRTLSLMGIAHGGQKVAALGREDWDIPLQIIATEGGLILPRH